MSEARFTPGPWTAPGHDGRKRRFELKRKFWEVGGGPEKRGVAFVFGDDEANARLIAAAPDLLEACRVALKDAEDCAADTIGTPQCEDFQKTADLLSAAIAKAEAR